MIPAAFRSLADAAIAAALSPRCAACAGRLDHPSSFVVCPACWSSIRAVPPPCCRTCGDPLPSWRAVSVAMDRCARCRRSARVLDGGSAAGEYEGALRQIIHAFKYEGRRSLARPLGARMQAAAANLLDDADCVVPVPLHIWRRMRRGFNQSADLSRAIGLPVVHALWRSRATVPQAGLTAAARRRNVRHAFRLSPLFTARMHEASLRGRIVVLVDDVRTTGATLEACARVLKAAGAREVRAMTAARAASPHQDR